MRKAVQKTIIVVDDENDILSLIQKILALNRYIIHPARNEKELFGLLEKVKPNLILLDIMLPGKDGYDICAQLKSKVETRDIPVIILTVLADPSHVEKGKRLGAIAYLTKPFEPKELEQVIKKVLK